MRFHPFWDSSPANVYVFSKSGAASALLPLLTFLALWLVMRVSRARSGLGTGRPGYGVVVLVALGLLVLVPFATYFVGSLLFLGLGLVILGWRGHGRVVWVAGLVLCALAPFATLGSFENRARFLGPAPTTVVLTLTALTILSLGLWHRRDERRTLAKSLAA
ncbi:MAG: hypothetical protein JWP95_1190 [Actinotalea sp.]|nr:hypothetical protein [Actinotalea sp.]